MSSKRGKKYQSALSQIDRDKHYSMGEAIDLVKKTSYSKFDGSVEMSLNLGVDPRHADQNVRSAVSLPNGLGKAVRIVVFAKGEKAIEAQKLNVEYVGGDDLAKKIQEGWLDFDQVVSTPDMMAVVGRLGKVLGPRGLMPNPKLGTVTFDVGTAVKELLAGKAQFKVDKAGIVHTPIGKVSMGTNEIKENAEAVIENIVKIKPATSKGQYLKKLSLAATMGPGVKVDLNSYR